ncbi:YeiH family protein [Paenibacillus ginsengarvi]|uniref:Putative sulfate exporter family transporter n=1 Tax=Paenibacillus ginsengarvi TaxID=400777 RepID=A0A3B0CK40_9BACL|nr:putative sulfate exporter family transporter [Paenibacillus ginsengarvi]RKN86035.1 putative sulfate exporter family transporter [Paenibacillus ginsengarvi]
MTVQTEKVTPSETRQPNARGPVPLGAPAPASPDSAPTTQPRGVAAPASSPGRRAWSLGVLFTMAVALIGWGAALLPGLDRLGPLACSIALAVVYRHFWGYPELLRRGIQFSSRTLLRLAIVLFGLRLDIGVVLHDGLGLLLRAAIAIAFAVALTVWLGKRFKADPSITLLLGIGTGICGAAAIAAVSPILNAKDEDTAIGAGMIALVGTIFAVGYTLLRPILPLAGVDYGTWSGISLHEIAHVALAAAPGGQDALAAGLLAKLSRVLLLVPFCLLLIGWKKRSGSLQSGAKMEFPWFLLGFIAMSLLGSYVLGNVMAVPAVMSGLTTGTTFLLSMAMVGLGLNVSLKQLRTKALRPVLAMSVTSLLLSAIAYMTI